MTVTLVSTARRLAVFVLLHDSYCDALGRCACARRRDGVRLPTALSVAARLRVTDLPDAVLAVPAVALAVREGSLRVERCAVAAPAPTVLPDGGPEGAPTTPVEVSDERRAPLFQSRRR
jgi:hypothetical protein